MTATEKELYNTAIKVFGPKHQTYVALEELGELQKELIKDLRGLGHRGHIVEEFADVCVALDQLSILYGIGEEEVAQQKTKKQLRLAGRCERGVDHE